MSFETRELRRAVCALCEDIRNKSNDGSDFDRGMQTAARRIAKEIGGLDLATPAPAQPEGQEDEPVMWECKHEEETDGRWRECLKREFAERDGLPGWDVRAFYLHPSRAAAPAEGAAS